MELLKCPLMYLLYCIQLGKHQHILLGRWLRKRYSHLLSDLYSPYDIYVRSTDTDRTLMSAESHLAGLYPPYGNEVWDSIKWMPIPVHTSPEDEDSVLAAKKYCPRYNYELENVLNSPEMKRIDKENEKLCKYLTKMTGNKISSLESVSQLYDVLFIEVKLWRLCSPLNFTGLAHLSNISILYRLFITKLYPSGQSRSFLTN